MKGTVRDITSWNVILRRTRVLVTWILVCFWFFIIGSRVRILRIGLERPWLLPASYKGSLCKLPSYWESPSYLYLRQEISL